MGLALLHAGPSDFQDDRPERLSGSIAFAFIPAATKAETTMKIAYLLDRDGVPGRLRNWKAPPSTRVTSRLASDAAKGCAAAQKLRLRES